MKPLKLKTCPGCKREVPYLITWRTITGGTILKCEKCEQKSYKSIADSRVMVDVRKWRPKKLFG